MNLPINERVRLPSSTPLKIRPQNSETAQETLLRPGKTTAQQFIPVDCWRSEEVHKKST